MKTSSSASSPPPAGKTPSPLCSLSLPPPVFGRAACVCFVGLPVLQHLCAGLMLLLWLPGSCYLAKRAIGWSGVCSEKGGQCFLTLCSVAFNSTRLTWELEERKKNNLRFAHTHTQTHCWRECAKTGSLVLHVTAMVQTWHYSGLVFDFLKSSGSPCSLHDDNSWASHPVSSLCFGTKEKEESKQ